MQNGKTALVLSSGGVFGAYQAGVWKILAGSFQPDLVVGASIGSINGWLIAGGCAPAELEELWLNAGQHLKIRARLPRHWSHGCMDSSGIEAPLAELYRRFPPQTGYATVLTDVFRRRPRIVTSAEMSWRHLLASCAVPGAFDLQRLGGSVYADGGLLCALPTWAAVELGATRIVAVHSQPEAPLPWRLTLSAGRALLKAPPSTHPLIQIITIKPQHPLGSFYEMLHYRRQRVESWIAQGESDARRLKHSIDECFERQ